MTVWTDVLFGCSSMKPYPDILPWQLTPTRVALTFSPSSSFPSVFPMILFPTALTWSPGLKWYLTFSLRAWHDNRFSWFAPMFCTDVKPSLFTLTVWPDIIPLRILPAQQYIIASDDTNYHVTFPTNYSRVSLYSRNESSYVEILTIQTSNISLDL